MYNFRYHLATILGIFLSLAIGLLLGAAIAGSELATDVSDDLVSSLQNEFKTITEQNDKLDAEIKVTNSVNTSFVDAWSAGLLNGKAILVISDDNHDDVLSRANTILSDAQATAVTMTVKKEGFALGDSDFVAALQKEFPALKVSETQLAQTLGTLLAAEWTSEPSESESAAASNEAANLDESTEEAEGETATETSSQETAALTGRPLTDYLIENGVITVATSDNALLQKVVISGVIDTALLSNGEADANAALITSGFSSNSLPVVLTQFENSTEAIRAVATEYSISCMGQLDSSAGKLGVLALLAGAPAGIYGTDLDEGSYVPTIPAETFARSTSQNSANSSDATN